MFCPSFRSKIVPPRHLSTKLTRIETFLGAACLRRFAVRHAPRQISRGRQARAKAAPLQARLPFAPCAPPWTLFSPQVLKHWASTSLERNEMNVPVNLLFDIEVAKSRLEEAFKPSILSNEWRKTPAANDRMDQSSPKTTESSIPSAFRLPEVTGCAGIRFQAL